MLMKVVALNAYVNDGSECPNEKKKVVALNTDLGRGGSKHLLWRNGTKKFDNLNIGDIP